MYKLLLCVTLIFSAPLLASPLIVAHRAGTADYPENTLPAIARALQHKADVIWVSVQLTKDQKTVNPL